MPQNYKKKFFIYGALFCLASILAQALNIESVLKSNISLKLPISIDVFAIIIILTSVALAAFGGKYFMMGITFNWTAGGEFNPYKNIYKLLIGVVIALLVAVISLSIRFNRL
jgi:hypothetical protein